MAQSTTTTPGQPGTIQRIRASVAKLGDGPLTEAGVREHIWPLFERTRAWADDVGVIYLANHSLGRPLDATADDMAEALDAWYTSMDGAWGPWMAEQSAYRARVARLIGRSRDDAVVLKTSAGQGLRAVLNALQSPTPNVIATRGEFDSIDFILRTYQQRGRGNVTWVSGDSDGLFQAEDICAAITPDTDLVVVPMVFFVTGQLLEGVERIVDRAHDCGAVVVLDTYHAAGVMPMDFDATGADFAIGGNYKYTRAGAGACWLAIHDRHLSLASRDVPADSVALATLDTGWFAKADTFKYERPDTPRLSAGGDAWNESTPPALVPYQARAGLELTLAIGVDRLRAYNQRQQALLADRLRSRRVDVHAIEPRGAFLLVLVKDRFAAMEAIEASGVRVDARPCPTTSQQFVRLCPDLLNPESELEAAAERIAGALQN